MRTVTHCCCERGLGAARAGGTHQSGINNQSPAGLAVMAGEPVVFSDLKKERGSRLPAFFLEHGIVSGMSVPVLGHPRPYERCSAFAAKAGFFDG